MNSNNSGALTAMMLLLLTLLWTAPTSAQCPDAEFEEGIIEYEEGKNDIMRSIGRLNRACTASFIKTSDNLDAPAYAITNGHCVGFVGEVENLVRTDYPVSGFIKFNNFSNTQDEAIVVDLEWMEYATMKGIDLAIMRLNKTVGEMKDLGLEPISIAQATGSEIGDDVKIAGVPSMAEESFLRYTQCSMTGRAPVVLEQSWFWRDMYENDCKGVYPGSSGSPVFNCFDEGMYALINTSNRDEEFPCDINSPCEVKSENWEFDSGTNYALDIRFLNDCFNSEGYFDMSLPNFPLDTGYQITTDYINAMRVYGGLTRANQINPELDITLDHLEITLSGKKYYRYKFVSYEESTPWEIEGYGDVLEVASDSVIQDKIPTEEVVYLLSILAGDTPEYDASWQKVEDATVIPIIVDKTPPSGIPEIFDTGRIPDSYHVAVEIQNEFYWGIYRADGGLDLDESDRSLYFSGGAEIPLVLPKEEGPYKVCAFYSDQALNGGSINCVEFGVKTDTDDPQIAEQITVYPNPSSDAVHIAVEGNLQINRIEIYDLLGKQVYKTTNHKSQRISIENQGLAAGMYILQIKTDQGLVNKRVIFH